MRIPATPPDYRAVLAGRPGPWLLEAIEAARSVADYPHWDKLRRRPCPEGLTSEQWWVGLKLTRDLVPLPLVDAAGRPFCYATPSIVLTLLNEAANATAGHLGVSERIRSDARRDRYLMSSLREEAISSSQLEGATTTRMVAKEMLRIGRRPRTLGEQMIANNFTAMQRIRECQHEPITPERVLELHAVLAANTMPDDHIGRIQRPDEARVGVYSPTNEELHRPPAAEGLRDRLELMCAFASGALDRDRWIHPLIRAIITHFMVGYDHYFADGNGRTARALFYWVSLREGHWLMEYISLSRVLKRAPAQYGLAYLHSETDDGDLTYFLLHQLTALTSALADLSSYLDRKQVELTTALTLSNRVGLNHRQLAAVSAGVHTPGLVITAKSHANSHAVTLQTARADLNELAGLGVLVAGKRGRAATWTVPLDIRARLAALGGQ